MQERKIVHFVHLPEWSESGGPVFALDGCDTAPLTDLVDEEDLDYTMDSELEIIPCVVLDGIDEIDERCIPDEDYRLPTEYYDAPGGGVYLQIADTYVLTIQEIVDTCATL